MCACCLCAPATWRAHPPTPPPVGGSLQVCAFHEWNLDGLVEMVWEYLDLVGGWTGGWCTLSANTRARGWGALVHLVLRLSADTLQTLRTCPAMHLQM